MIMFSFGIGHFGISESGALGACEMKLEIGRQVLEFMHQLRSGGNCQSWSGWGKEDEKNIKN